MANKAKADMMYRNCNGCCNLLSEQVKYIFENMTEEEIQAQYRNKIPNINFMCYLCICENYGNQNVYIPGISRYYKLARNNYIRRNHKNESFRELSNKYSLTERQLRRILK